MDSKMIISLKKYNVTSTSSKKIKFKHPIVSNSCKPEIIFTTKIKSDKFKRLRVYHDKDLFQTNCDEIYGDQLLSDHLVFYLQERGLNPQGLDWALSYDQKENRGYKLS
jgi:hypothetical protein